MPDVQEVFRMATQKLRPEPGFVDRQLDHQRRRARNRKNGALGLAIVLAVVAAVITVQAGRDTRRSETTPADQSEGNPAIIELPGGRPSGIAEAGGSIWVATFEGRVYRIDPTTEAIVDTILLNAHLCGDLVVNKGSIYVSACGYWPPVYTARIDGSTGAVTEPWSTALISPVFGAERLWGFDAGAPRRDGVEADPATGEKIAVLSTPPLGYAFGSLWTGITSDSDGRSVIVRTDPDTGDALATYVLPDDLLPNSDHGKIGGFAEASGSVWVTVYQGDPSSVRQGVLLRLDPSSDAVQKVLALSLDPKMDDPHPFFGAPIAEYGPGPEAFLTAHDSEVWIAQSPNSVVGIDASSGAIVRTFAAAGAEATNIEVTDDAVWITNYADGTVWRYDLTSTD